MTRKITPLAALAVVAATVLLSGCGNAATSSRIRTPAAKSTGGTAVSLPRQYSQCMRDHGVPNFPDPVDGRIVIFADGSREDFDAIITALGGETH